MIVKIKLEKKTTAGFYLAHHRRRFFWVFHGAAWYYKPMHNFQNSQTTAKEYPVKLMFTIRVTNWSGVSLPKLSEVYLLFISGTISS